MCGAGHGGSRRRRGRGACYGGRAGGSCRDAGLGRPIPVRQHTTVFRKQLRICPASARCPCNEQVLPRVHALQACTVQSSYCNRAVAVGADNGSRSTVIGLMTYQIGSLRCKQLHCKAMVELLRRAHLCRAIKQLWPVILQAD